MSDVARLAGVSHMTVSRVINEPWRVRAATRERVQAAIETLGYRPNSAARSLVTRKSHTIGVVALNTTLFGPASTLHGLEEAAREAGYFVSVASAQRLTTEDLRASVHRLVDQSVDGIVVIAPLRSAAQVVGALDPSVPAVSVEGVELGVVPCVAVDQHLGARLVVEHLLSLGHRTVHHISGPRDWTEAEARAEGWRSTLRAARRRVPAAVVGDWSARSGYEAARLLADKPDLTALFVANDHMALGALRALQERGLRVPEDVSVVGFDDVPECAYYLPPLTTVRQDFAEIGRQSIRVLVQQMTGETSVPTSHLLAPSLVVRASTAPPTR
ncbi:LacI family DNA-binding transcriptional regulator [Micromonospora sp. BQ11]|uniref:LacI family DNA-binding transcriptional regulator n=1 Tax=Micromonospora sp. BQ11 TaxID=3452212 RepID=UPI003F897AE3